MRFKPLTTEQQQALTDLRNKALDMASETTIDGVELTVPPFGMPTALIVASGDTYNHRSELKTAGFRYHEIHGWHKAVRA